MVCTLLYTQAEDRAHRIGQLSNVRVIYLVSRNTIDELIWPMISKKLEILNKAGLSRDTFDNTANPLELKESQTMMDEFVTALDQNQIESMFGSQLIWSHYHIPISSTR